MIYENELKKFKTKYQDTEVVDIINELAVQMQYLEVHPFISWKTVDEIVNKKSDILEFVALDQTDVNEGSMSTEFYYDLIFKDLDTYKLYGAKLDSVPQVNGEMWGDFIANDGDESNVEVKLVKEEKEVKVKYIFQ